MSVNNDPTKGDLDNNMDAGGGINLDVDSMFAEGGADPAPPTGDDPAPPVTPPTTPPTTPPATPPKDPKKEGDEGDKSGGAPPPDDKGKKDGEEEFVELLLDDQGNLTDESGKILYKKDEYTMDDKGNVTITKTPAQSSNAGNVVKTYFKEKYKLELGETEFADVESKDGVDLEKVVDGVLKHSGEIARKSMFEKYPIMEQVYNHLAANGGKIDGFMDVVKNPAIPVLPDANVQDENATAMRKQFIQRDLEEAFGVAGIQDANIKAATMDRIKNILADIELRGTLHAEAANSRNSIVARDDARKQAQAERDKAAIAQQAEQQALVVKDIQKIVNSGKIKNLKVSPEDAKGLLNYILNADPVTGKTAEEVDYGNEELENSLMFSFMRYKGYDFGSLVSLIAANEAVNNIRVKAAGRKFKVSGGGKGGNNNEPLSDGEIADLGSINVADWIN